MSSTDPDGDHPDNGPSSYPPPSAGPGAGSARTLTMVSFFLAAVAFLFIPLVGIVAVVLAVIAMRRGDALARWALVAAIVGTVLGLAIGIAFYEGEEDEALALLLR